MTVRMAVLGVGRIGRMHAELLSRRVADVDVVAVTDAVEATAREVAGHLGVPAAPSVAAVLADDSVEAVCIATSTDTHVDLLVDAAAAGKAALCEKPISLDLAEVDRGLAAVAAAGVPLQIGFNRRFDPSHRAVAEAVRRGDIGDLHLLRITSRDPAPPPLAYLEVSGGIFLDMTIHDFDMARFVAGSEVTTVSAVGGVRIDEAIGAVGDLDTAVVTLTHADGAITVIDNSRQAVYGYDQRIEAFGSAGMALSDNPRATTASVASATGFRSAALPHFFLERYIPSYLAQWEAFVRAVATGEPTAVDGRDGRAPLVLGLAAWRSVREGGRPVAVEEIG